MIAIVKASPFATVQDLGFPAGRAWGLPPSGAMDPVLLGLANGLVGKNILGTDFSVDITLTWGAGAYIVGEETGLIESLEGRRGCPA